jgi:Flp pilus assembly protein TadG
VRNRPFALGPNLTRRARARVRDLVAATHGVAAVEFAMILPGLLLLYIGMSEASVGWSLYRKVTLVSRSVADLTARSTTLSAADLTKIFGAASAIAAPYPTASMQMRISQIAVTSANGQVRGKVCWSKGQGGLPDLSTGSDYDLPAGYDTAGSFFVVAEVKLPYQPAFGYAFTGSVTLAETTPWPIRNVAQVAYSGFKTFKDTEMGRSATGTC